MRADKAYSSAEVRSFCRKYGIRTTVLEPGDRVWNRQERVSWRAPLAFDAESYKGRIVVERRFCDFKQWRGIATRYDKLAIVFRAGVMCAAMVAWLKHLSNTP